MLSQFSCNVERASVDEAYIELTKEISNLIKNEKKKIHAEDLPFTWVQGYNYKMHGETDTGK